MANRGWVWGVVLHSVIWTGGLRHALNIVGMLLKCQSQCQVLGHIKILVVLTAIHSTPHHLDGVSPLRWWQLEKKLLFLYISFISPRSSVSGAYTANQFVTDLCTHLQNTFAFAQNNLPYKLASKAKRPIVVRGYKIGDQVLYFNFIKHVDTQKKFLPNKSGLHNIVDKPLCTTLGYRNQTRVLCMSGSTQTSFGSTIFQWVEGWPWLMVCAH